jgi:hypothetical protein
MARGELVDDLSRAPFRPSVRLWRIARAGQHDLSTKAAWELSRAAVGMSCRVSGSLMR